jgi:hypothetical protein
MSEVAARLQEEVSEIAEVLARQQGKRVSEVWQEALTLHRVRYETEVVKCSDPGPTKRHLRVAE